MIMGNGMKRALGQARLYNFLDCGDLLIVSGIKSILGALRHGPHYG